MTHNGLFRIGFLFLLLYLCRFSISLLCTIVHFQDMEETVCLFVREILGLKHDSTNKESCQK